MKENLRGFEFCLVPDAESLGALAAEFFVSQVRQSLEAQAEFTVALSGGSTPKKLFHALVDRYQKDVPWSKIHFFWGDERFVPPTDSESNFKMAYDELLSRVGVPEQNIHRVKTELGDAHLAAQDYQAEIKKYFSEKRLSEPQFDLVWLGIGEDGHTASLFPDGDPTPEMMKHESAWVVAPWVHHLNSHRITLTPGVINLAKQVVFLVSGLEKAKVMSQVQEGDTRLPCVDLIRPEFAEPLWIIDQPAASGFRHEKAA